MTTEIMKILCQKYPWGGKKYCRTSSSKDKFSDNEIWPFAVSTQEEGQGYRLGQVFPLVI